METIQRKELRSRRGQLLTLLNGWDPVGLLWAGAPRNEYDCIVDALLGLLTRGATRGEVSAFLEKEVSERFGTTAPDASQFAARVVAWFEMVSREH